MQFIDERGFSLDHGKVLFLPIILRRGRKWILRMKGIHFQRSAFGRGRVSGFCFICLVVLPRVTEGIKGCSLRRGLLRDKWSCAHVRPCPVCQPWAALDPSGSWPDGRMDQTDTQTQAVRLSGNPTSSSPSCYISPPTDAHTPKHTSN